MMNRATQSRDCRILGRSGVSMAEFPTVSLPPASSLVNGQTHYTRFLGLAYTVSLQTTWRCLPQLWKPCTGYDILETRRGIRQETPGNH
jgi:hypothetical protein